MTRLTPPSTPVQFFIQARKMGDACPVRIKCGQVGELARHREGRRLLADLPRLEGPLGGAVAPPEPSPPLARRPHHAGEDTKAQEGNAVAHRQNARAPLVQGEIEAVAQEPVDSIAQRIQLLALRENQEVIHVAEVVPVA